MIELFPEIVLREGVRRDPSFDGFVPDAVYVTTPWLVYKFRKYEYDRGERLFDICGWRRAKEDLDSSVVAFHQSGAIGDELIWTPFVYAFGDANPEFEIVNYAVPPNHYATYGMRHIGMRGHKFFIGWPESVFSSFRRVIAPDPVGYLNRASKENIYSLCESEIGVTPYARVPYVHITGMERDEVIDVLHGQLRIPPIMWEKLIVLQVNAGQAARSPSQSVVAAVLRGIVDALEKDGYWFALIGSGDVCANVVRRAGLARFPRVLRFGIEKNREHLSTRSIMQLIEGARVCVSLDSMPLHAAAAFDVPTVALWNINGECAQEYEPSPTLEIEKLRNDYARRGSMFIPDGVDGAFEAAIPAPESRVATYSSVRSVHAFSAPTKTIVDSICDLT